MAQQPVRRNGGNGGGKIVAIAISILSTALLTGAGSYLSFNAKVSDRHTETVRALEELRGEMRANRALISQAIEDGRGHRANASIHQTHADRAILVREIIDAVLREVEKDRREHGGG